MRPGAINELRDTALIIAITRQKITGPVMEAVTFGAYDVMHRPLSKNAVLQALQELEDLGSEIKHIIPVTSLPPNRPVQ